MNVLHLISSSGFFGAERVVAELCKYSEREGIETIIGVFCRNIDVIKLFKKAGITSKTKIVSFDGSKLFSIKVLKTVSDLIRDHNIAVVHSHGYKSDIYAFWAAKYKNKTLRLVATNHNWIGETCRERVYQYIDKQHLRYFDAVIAVSDLLKKQMVQAGIEESIVDIIDNGIDINDSAFETDKSSARSVLGLAADDYVVGCVARLTCEKAHINLIHGFATFLKQQKISAKLVLIGDGPEKERLQNECLDLGVSDSVMFVGNRDDVRSLYAAFDVFALVSTNEGLPMAMLEAMSARIPVVVTRVGSMPEVIEHRKNGIVIACSDTQAIVGALDIYYSDPSNAKIMALEAFQKVSEYYSSIRMTKEYLQLYERLLNGQQNNIGACI